MTKRQAQKQLEAIGFHFPTFPNHPPTDSLWGNMTPEKVVDVGKDTFRPLFRDVFVSGYCRQHGGFYYITSHIKGTLHRHRSRYCNDNPDAQFANIFASGKTLAEAVEKFVRNFKNRIYNISR